jgi:hypothetical protein
MNPVCKCKGTSDMGKTPLPLKGFSDENPGDFHTFSEENIFRWPMQVFSRRRSGRDC